MEWGEIEGLRPVPPGHYRFSIDAREGTILLLGSVLVGVGSRFATASVSTDDGQHWSAWDTLGYGRFSAWGAVTSSAVLYDTWVTSSHLGLYRSTDGGQSWQTPEFTWTGLEIIGQRQDTVIMAFQQDSVLWTADGGLSFSPPRSAGLLHGGLTTAALSDGWLHVANPRRDTAWDRQTLRYHRARQPSGAFEAERELNADLFCTNSAGLEFAGDGTGILLSLVQFTGPAPGLSALLRHTTRDHGASWTVDTLVARESCYWLYPLVRCAGHYWVCVWEDTTRQPGFTRGGVWYQFSANHGRSWYPAAQAVGDSTHGWPHPTDVNVDGERVRLYFSRTVREADTVDWYLRRSGQIQPDPTPPVLLGARELPELLAGGETQPLWAMGRDNDSLWQVQAVIRRESSLDSLVIPLVRDPGEDTLYWGQWPVPTDTADWLYYYRLEDMWEHVVYAPAEGSVNPWRTHVGPLGASDEFIVPRSSFIVSCFPNPFNSATTLRFSLPVPSEVTLTLYDVTGRVVLARELGRLAAGEHSERIKAKGMASGIYFVSLRAGTQNIVRRIALVR